MKKLKSLLLLTTAFAFDSSSGWKLDEDGKIEMKDGNPIYLDGSGREMSVNGDTISRLNGEAKTHREAKEKAETALQVYEGLDADKAREAIEKLSKIDAKDLIDSGEVDKVKDEITRQFAEKDAEKDARIAELTGKLDSMRVDKVFESSEFVRENIDLPQDMFQAYFRNSFKVEDNEVVAYDKSGNRLMSQKSVGEYAKPDEALQLLVNTHPQKDRILKADDQSGSGGSNSGGMRGGARSISRADLEKMNPAQQAEVAGKAGKGEINITD